MAKPSSFLGGRSFWTRSLVREVPKEESRFLSSSLFYLWLVSIVLISRSEQWLNFENVSEILDYGVRPWFPNMGKVFFVYTHNQ